MKTKINTIDTMNIYPELVSFQGPLRELKLDRVSHVDEYNVDNRKHY